MRSNEFKLFEEQIKQLAAGFGRRADDRLVQAYWRSLIDVSLDEVIESVTRYLRTASSETKFPKPAQLRKEPPPEPTSRVVRSADMDAAFARAEAECIRNWEDLRRKDPETLEIEIRIAKVGRILATAHESTPEYAEAVELDRKWRDIRFSMWQRRAIARQQ